MGANSTLLRLFLRMPMSPLLIATCAQFDQGLTGNKMVDVKPEELVSEIANGIFVKFH